MLYTSKQDCSELLSNMHFFSNELHFICGVNFTFTKVNSPLPFSLFHNKMKWTFTVCKLSFPLCPKWTSQQKWRWFDYIWTPMRQPGARSAPRRPTLICYGMKCELPEMKINYHEYWTEISNLSICTSRMQIMHFQERK
jgi:hypothetical protein